MAHGNTLLISGMDDTETSETPPVMTYETEGIVDFWSKVYELEKEREFVKCIDKYIPKDRMDLLDIGCGLGLHTELWRERGKKVTASDFSTQFRDYIVRTYTFPFIWMDVLNCTIREQYDICFCMAIGTILHDEERRFQTFETLGRLVSAGGVLVLVTGSNQWPFYVVAHKEPLHSVNERDIEKLRSLGLEIATVFRWGTSPKFLWRAPVFKLFGRLVEALSFHLGIGARKVVVCRRKACMETGGNDLPTAPG
jgi:SAM-dependent methyltransferase